MRNSLQATALVANFSPARSQACSCGSKGSMSAAQRNETIRIEMNHFRVRPHALRSRRTSLHEFVSNFRRNPRALALNALENLQRCFFLGKRLPLVQAFPPLAGSLPTSARPKPSPAPARDPPFPASGNKSLCLSLRPYHNYGHNITEVNEKPCRARSLHLPKRRQIGIPPRHRLHRQRTHALRVQLAQILEQLGPVVDVKEIEPALQQPRGTSPASGPGPKNRRRRTPRPRLILASAASIACGQVGIIESE